MAEPSKAARERRDELYKAVGWPDDWSLADVHAHAFALYIDEVDRALESYLARWCNGTPGKDEFKAHFSKFMLPDPPDPDEELAREVAEQFATIYPHAADAVALATIKRLREQGRLADAK